jgi:hypothetical protein
MGATNNPKQAHEPNQPPSVSHNRLRISTPEACACP